MKLSILSFLTLVSVFGVLDVFGQPVPGGPFLSTSFMTKTQVTTSIYPHSIVPVEEGAAAGDLDGDGKPVLGCRGQSFEGEIIYFNSYTSKSPGLTDDRLRVLLGDKQEYYIKGSRYRSVTNGGLVQVQVYDPVNNRVYNQRPGNDTLYWIDAAANPDVVISWTIRRNAETVLGVPCDELSIKTNNGSVSYYYSERYRLDSAGFRRHRFGNWDFLSSKCGALPLKSVVENGQFRMESVATEIKPMVLTDAFFAIDDKLPVKRGM